VPSKEALDLYEAPLALIRPDQVVAWRGTNDTDAQMVLTTAAGRATNRDEHGPTLRSSGRDRSAVTPEHLTA
jgi:hypothetical protein